LNCSLPECGKALKPPILQCSKCHAVAYCSRACQVKAWKAGHKRECSAAAADEHVNVARLPEITQALHDADEVVQEAATRELRQLLSSKCPPIKQVIKAGVVPRCIDLLSRWHRPSLQYEAAYALSNIASGASKFTSELVEKGALPALVKLLASPSDEVREQAVWALGNIAGDSAQLRDKVLNHNVLPPLIKQLNVEVTSVSRVTAWMLSNLSRGTPPPSLELIKPALPGLAVLISSTDKEVLADVCWSISYISDGDTHQIQPVIDAGVGKRLVELLMHESPQVKKPALRAVGNIVTGDDTQAQYIINCGVLPCLHQLLSNDCAKIRQETAWILSNMTCTGSKDQLQRVIDHNIFPILVHMLDSEDTEIRHECAWAIYNATFIGDHLQIKYFVDTGCVQTLVKLLDGTPDVRVVSLALESLENILKNGLTNQQVSESTRARERESERGLERARGNARVAKGLGFRVQGLGFGEISAPVNAFERAVCLVGNLISAQLSKEVIASNDGGHGACRIRHGAYDEVSNNVNICEVLLAPVCETPIS